jgi:hypothetical protein
VTGEAGHPEHVVARQQRDLLAFAERFQQQLRPLVGSQRRVTPRARAAALVGGLGAGDERTGERRDRNNG